MVERTPDKEFFTKAVGVTKGNPDGSSRQDIIARCKIGEALELIHQPNNRYDPNAIAVHRRKTGEQIGFLNRDLASDLVRDAAAGKQFSAEISDLTGGGFFAKKTCGVNIKIRIYGPQ